MEEPTAGNRQIELMISRLYENERLTDALTDESAKLLLAWGTRQLNNLAQVRLSPKELDQAGQALERALRLVNRLIEQRAGLSESEMVEQLLKLVDHVIFLTTIIQQNTSQEIPDDQAETESSKKETQ